MSISHHSMMFHVSLIKTHFFCTEIWQVKKLTIDRDLNMQSMRPFPDSIGLTPIFEDDLTCMYQ